MKAIQLWKEGLKVTEIASRLECSRGTVYRWIKNAGEKLSKTYRARQTIDPITKSRVLELYILLKRPSMRVLSEKLAYYFHIHIKPHQLRRYLIAWGFYDFQPSPLFVNILSESVSSLKNAFGSFRETENFRREIEHFERQDL